MAQLKDLIVAGASRFLGKTYFEDSVTFNDTLILAKTTDASGTIDNRPALIVGGLPNGAHIEIDANEIISKTNGTTTANLYLNSDGGDVFLGQYVQVTHTSTGAEDSDDNAALIITGGLSTTQASYFGGNINAGSEVKVAGLLSANSGADILITTTNGVVAASGGALAVSGGARITHRLFVGTDLNVQGTATIKGATTLSNNLNVGGLVSLANDIEFTGVNRDQWINFKHTGSETGYDWRIGHQGTGSSDANYFVIQSNSNTDTYTDVLRFGLTTYAAYFGGNVTVNGNVLPNGTRDLGSTTAKWNSLYISTANLSGNVGSTSSSTGTLVVTGGVGISENLYLGGKLNVAGGATLGDNTSDTHLVKGNMTHNGVVYFANGTNYYVNSSGGAKLASLNVTGDTTLAGKVFIGDNAADTHKITGTTTVNGTLNFANGSTYYINNSGSAMLHSLTTDDIVQIKGNAGSTSMTTGQMIVTGGLGVSGQVNAKTIRLDNSAYFEYNSTDKCIDVIFG